MDPRSLLYQAAYLNDKGCALMENGQQHEAFEVFIQAGESIATLTRLVEQRRELEQHHHRTLSLLPSRRRKERQIMMGITAGSNYNIMKSSDFSFERRCNHRGATVATSASTTTDFGVGLTGRPNYICNQTFRFIPRESHVECCDETAVHYFKLCQAGITFNSALSFHQRSYGADGSLKGIAQSAASDLYLDAMSLLKDCFFTPDSCRFLVATFNNAAILFLEMNSYDKFKVFQTELHRLLVDIQTSFPGVMEPHHLESFFFNATLLSMPVTAGAA